MAETFTPSIPSSSRRSAASNAAAAVDIPVEAQQLYQISQIVSRTQEWKPALDQISRLVRSIFIFDNLALYLCEDPEQNFEVMYARAVGRGRSSEADVAWGEELASQVLAERRTIIREAPGGSAEDRLNRPYILGIPLCDNQRCFGVVIFIRFGGPTYTQPHIDFAEFIAQQISLLMVRQRLKQDYETLEDQHRQSRLQNDFISTISHELRSPLGFIKGYTTTLLRPDAHWDETVQREFLTIIDSETDHLQELINNLLDSARLQSGQMPMRFQSIRLESLLHDITDRAHVHYPDLQITLEANPVQLVHGDPRRLAQVFENLINNAVKYAPGSPITIRLEQEDQIVHIQIIDRGPGIKEEYLTRIFERFFRNPEQETTVHGSGLGLFICQQIIHAHNGQILAASQMGQGTTFHILLPIQI